ncbi:hypothetical protein DVK02_09225 [Halobellus sp. Atlit-31R]|nr:hypothetical protein DVK02_09225 [Halobellus sp. Atlit-31R]
MAALAGCGAESGASGSRRESGPGADPPADALRDPTVVTLRNPDRRPIVFTDADAQTQADAGSDADADADAGSATPIDDWEHVLVTDSETAASLSFADVDGVDAARALLEETDFDAESVYVERHTIGECYERQLCWVRWGESEIETDYARLLRDADVACEADAEDVVTSLIRLPVALDPDQITRHSSGTGGGPCRTPTNGEVRR